MYFGYEGVQKHSVDVYRCGDGRRNMSEPANQKLG